MMKNYDFFNNINAFKMEISYLELNSASSANVHNHHIHDECEIYINLSGDVSFAVENSLYPILPGNIIITHPHEYHHCIYHSEKLHKHFWILFQASNNKELFDIFFNREREKNNLLVLDIQQNNELIKICHKLAEGITDDIEKHFYFFALMSLLNKANIFSAPNTHNTNSIMNAVNYINNNFSSKLSIKELAQSCNCSISTFERHFTDTFNLSPLQYIKQRRLTNAIKMLSDGVSVTDAAYFSGFSDCSKFIVSFKQAYGITPLQYKKNCMSKILKS